MGYQLDAAGTSRLGKYFAEIGEVLGGKPKRASFAIYNTVDEVDRLVAGIERAIEFFGRD